jgi:hypothetical protein
MLAVEHSPRQTIPELVHRLENDGEVSSSVASEKAVNVFEDNNFWPTLANQGCEVMEESRLVSPQSCPWSHSGEGEVLAGEARRPDVGVRDISRVDTLDVLLRDDVGKVLSKHSATKRLLFTLEYALDPRSLKAEIEPTYAGKEGRMV